MMRAFAEATTDYPRLLQVVADQISALIGDGCFVALLAEDGQSLQPVSVRFRDPASDEVARGFLTAGPIRMEGSSLGVRVVRTRNPVLLPRVDLEALAGAVASNHAALVRSLAISSFLLLPLEIHGRALGFISLARVSPEGPGALTTGRSPRPIRRWRATWPSTRRWPSRTRSCWNRASASWPSASAPSWWPGGSWR